MFSTETLVKLHLKIIVLRFSLSLDIPIRGARYVFEKYYNIRIILLKMSHFRLILYDGLNIKICVFLHLTVQTFFIPRNKNVLFFILLHYKRVTLNENREF